MRVLFLAEDVGAAYSSYTVFARSLASEMRAQGHQILLAHTRRVERDAGGAGRLDGPGPYDRVYGIGLPRHGLFYPLHFLLCLAQLAWIVRAERVDWVHLHFHGRDRWFWGAARFLARKPYGVVWHSLNPGALSPWRRIYLGSLLKGGAWTTALSRFSLGQLRSLWPEVNGKGHVVRPGADHAVLPGPSPRSPILETCSKEPFILYLGRVTPEKGSLLLLLAFHDLPPAVGRNVRLVLCGPLRRASYEDLIARLGLAGRVLCLGVQDKPVVSELMKRCLFLALPSQAESFGLAALEAMAHGKPVVASTVGGIPEYVEDGRNGLLVAAGRVQELRDAMLRLVGDGPLRQRMGLNALETARRFRWSDAARRYWELCRN